MSNAIICICCAPSRTTTAASAGANSCAPSRTTTAASAGATAAATQIVPDTAMEDAERGDCAAAITCNWRTGEFVVILEAAFATCNWRTFATANWRTFVVDVVIIIT